MAEEPSKTPGTSAERPSPQIIPLSKIHDLPGVFIPKQPDKSYGGLVSSIQASGVKEPVILRLREDGEYQLVAGYRRRRGSELAKKQDIPAFVYEMTLQEAVDYHRRVQNQPALPIPGKLVKPTVEKKTEQPAPAAVSIPKEPAMGKTESKPDGKTADAPKETAPAKDSPATKEGKVTPTAPAADTPKPKEKPTEGKPEAKPDAKTADAPKETTPAKDGPAPKEGKVTSTAPAADAPKPREKPTEGKPDGKAADTPKESKEAPATPAAGTPKPKEQPTEGKMEAKPDGKIADTPKETAPAKDGPAPKESSVAPTAPASDTPKSKEQPAEGKTEAKPDAKTADTPKETAPAKDSPAPKEGKEAPATPTIDPPKPNESIMGKTEPIVTGPSAKGPAGTQITQVFEDRLAPPDDKALNDLPSPKEGESYFIVLHPGYLEKSKFNKITVDPNSEDYRELKKSIELNGVKDPVLTRINPEGGGLEIVSGQRRHMIAKELNYPVPAIIQKLSDADVMILVNDGNLHRPHISTYDLAISLRGKMEGMKQKAGRKKKGAPTAEELNSDEKLAQEMGMSVSKLNRIIRLSEASKDVCDRVDDGSLALSIASAISFLKPQNQDEVLHLNDLGYKLSTERIEYMKKVEKAGKLDENSMRLVLEGENVLEPPKVVPMPQPAPTAPAQSQPGAKPDAQGEPSLPPSPDLKPQPEQPKPATQESPTQAAPAPAPVESGKKPEPVNKEADERKGEQNRPEYTKVILAGDRLRKYFPDVTMTPREIEESIYDALEERRQRLEKKEQKKDIFKKGPTR